MYINPFICGILATLGAELIALIVAVSVTYYRSKKGGRK